MPPASSTAPNANKPRLISLGTSPDTDNAVTEPELQPRLSKKARKKERQAAKLQDEPDRADQVLDGDVTATPAIPIRSVLSQIPRSFPRPDEDIDYTVRDQPEDLLGEKVSEQFLAEREVNSQEEVFGDVLSKDVTAPSSLGGSPPVQPGFSTRASYAARSPPTSPPQRSVRPVSYGGGIPPAPHRARMSTSPYAYPPGLYGSPPAPHLPQQHFYHARDVDVGGLPRSLSRHSAPEPSLVKHTIIPLPSGEKRQGILLGFEGRISLVATDRGRLEEVGALTELPGTVVDAVLVPLEKANGLVPPTDLLIAVVLHSKEDPEDASGTVEVNSGIPIYPSATSGGTGYATRVVLYSLTRLQVVATILETPLVYASPSFRGSHSDVPPPTGNLKLLTSGHHLVVASGTSGEVFVFVLSGGESMAIECIGKLWTNVQPQNKRRDSSHGRVSDTEMSPADLTRGSSPTQHAVVDLQGRWLVIAPASAPSRPSLGIQLGASVECRRNASVESIVAPTRPSLTCDVDSPDADTLFGKVARGVAQELVKGAKWLGDQGYQTWQNYWKKDSSSPPALNAQAYSPPTYLGHHPPNAFPPTHGETVPVSKEPELVSVFDLVTSRDMLSKRPVDELKPIATFQPPRGCSYLSMSPTGLNLLTAGRKGDVQYVWDLMQIRHCRAFLAVSENDQARPQPRVRQIARYERLSGATIVDVSWEGPAGARFAILTQNRTIHMFDLPPSASRWPPPRNARRAKQAGSSVDTSQANQTANLGGLLASAMNMASKAQPMVAGWRGRAPSVSGGLAGIGQTGIGIASATGARGGKAVAAGLSKSLGAATETVHHIRHAGESRLHLRSPRGPLSGRMFWSRRGRDYDLVVVDPDFVKSYRTRKSRPKDKGRRDSVSVFDARKAINMKIPKLYDLRSDFVPSQRDILVNPEEAIHLPGFYQPTHIAPLTTERSPLQHPLSYAEVETNAPYQPFHSDRRLRLSILDGSQATSYTQAPTGHAPWVFGNDIPAVKVSLHHVQIMDEDQEDPEGSIIYRETTIAAGPGDNAAEQIVSTTRRSRKRRDDGAGHDRAAADSKEDIFEDDCEVLDFATDRV